MTFHLSPAVSECIFPFFEKYGPSGLNGMHFAYFILDQFL